MQRVAVLGPGGAGKSTFARALGQRTGLPVVHLDEHFWSPGWVETPRPEWAARQAELFAADRWIADGNYSGTLDIRLARADTVVLFALPGAVCVAGALRRSIANYRRPVQAPGCPERVDPQFLRWIWNYQRRSRPRVDEVIARHRDHLDVYEVRSRRETAALLDRLAADGTR